MLLLKGDNNTGHFLHKIDVPVSYSALLLRLTGTNSATALALRDVGRIRYWIRNKPVVDCDFDYLVALTDVIGGHGGVYSTASGALNFYCLIPRFWLDDNVESVTKEDDPTFEINFGANVATRVASGFLCELYAITDEGVQLYNLKIIQTENSISGAGVFTHQLSSVENLCAVYISDVVSSVLTLASSGISRVQGNCGDQKFNMSVSAMQSGTVARNNLEDPAGTAGDYNKIGEIFAAEIGDLNGRLADAIDINLTTTASAVPQFLLIGMDFNPNKLVETSAQAGNKYRNFIRNKSLAGKNRTVSTLEAVTKASVNLQK